MIRIRFMTGADMLSRLIRTQGGIAMPFTPSHTEALTPDGKYYIGAHIKGGIDARPFGYDDGEVKTLADGRKADITVSLPCSEAQEAAFYAYAWSKVGAPYDWRSIISFAAPDINMHVMDHLICSAFMTAALRTKGCEYFPMPLTVPFHHISPRDLLLMLSSHVQIDH